ncbi:hypothetical protein [Methylobacterium durans]|uniref:3',5'-cyclic-nucleotide phosphodiesterase n=1 Tax=Methylobacterium durans TaxID=2202825 RepID=A0A2U8WF27_9HYPH|nr:hypothetical protein [Methylobacterium durans]AWN43936.1 hypothetical protein DK389_29775 [Methylobacterium durans]
MRLPLRLIVGPMVLALMATTASHAEPSTAQREACTPDVWRLCSGEIPNVTRITACLRREKARLSPDCRAVFNTSGRPRSAGL